MTQESRPPRRSALMRVTVALTALVAAVLVTMWATELTASAADKKPALTPPPVVVTTAQVQARGRVWMGPTTWAGRKAIRVSVSNWQTGDEEIELAVEEFRAAQAGQVPAR